VLDILYKLQIRSVIDYGLIIFLQYTQTVWCNKTKSHPVS
jgi:hypothetical protein